MTKRIILVKKAGLLTTIQDLGRFGSQQYGVVVGGVMDSYSARVANILVGNHQGEAVLEMTMIGAELAFECDAVISICGGGLQPVIDGYRYKMWQSIQVRAGQTLSFFGNNEGVRTYVAINGGFRGESILGSQSTYLRGRFGGNHGRPLQKGDTIKCGEAGQTIRIGQLLSPTAIPDYPTSQVIRVILGPDLDYFTKTGIDTFLSSKYTISKATDRMGYRFTGDAITHRKSANILSDSVTFGTIQVPEEGLPIVMMADRQTTGGYPRIAHVISVDLPKLAQLMPGNNVYFSKIELDEAQNLYAEREFFFKRLELVRGVRR